MSFMDRLKLVFTLGNSLKIALLSFVTFLTCYLVADYSNSRIKEVLQESLLERASILQLDSKKDITVIKCVLLNCMYIEKNKIFYEFKDRSFYRVRSEIKKESIASSTHKVSVNGVTYYLNIDLENNLLSIAKMSSYMSGLITFNLLLLFLILSFNNRRFNYRVTKDMLEDLIQKELTESLHHELSGPVVVLEGKIDMLKNMSPDDPNRAVILDNLDNSISLIRDILNIMANRKHLKYTNGTISIERLIENSVAFNRIKHLGVLDIIIDDKDKELFSNYSLLGLDNGVLVNILNNLITNSTEAGASEVKVYGTLREVGTIDGEKYPVIDLYCKDNGSGIRDKNGNISNTKEIFNYCYSTKDQLETVSKNSIMDWIKSIFGGINDIQSIRGAGLAISKKLLLSVNDDIVLHETSVNGTTFKLTLKVKKRLINDDESKLIESVKMK